MLHIPDSPPQGCFDGITRDQYLRFSCRQVHSALAQANPDLLNCQEPGVIGVQHTHGEGRSGSRLQAHLDFQVQVWQVDSPGVALQ